MALGFTTVRPLGSSSSGGTGGVPYRTGAAPQSSGFTVSGPSAFSTPSPSAPASSDPWSIKGNPAYQQTPYSAPPPPDYSAGIKSAQTAYGADLLSLERDNARAAARAEFMGGDYYPTKEAGLRADYSIGQRGADLDMRDIGVQRGAATRDSAYYQQLLQMMPAYRHLSGTDLNTAISEAKRQGNMQRIGIDSAATAGGGWFAPMRSVKNFDSYLGQANAEQRASTNFYRDQLGLNEKEAGLSRSKAMTGDQLAKLDIDAARVGLSREKLQNALTQGLNALGYDKFMSMQDLIALKDSGDARGLELWNKIIQAGTAIADGAAGDAYTGFQG